MESKGSRLIAEIRGDPIDQSYGAPKEETTSVPLSKESRGELMDPEAWQHILQSYGATVKLAVALTDREGNLLGNVYNPQRLWQLARKGNTRIRGACSFCLTRTDQCDAVVSAIRTGGPVMVQDAAGLAHVAVPLSLNGQTLGALIAGQVFNQYPEPLPLQRAARELGIPQQSFWNEAIQQMHVSRASLGIYGTLLMTLGAAFLGQRFSTILYRVVSESHKSMIRSLEEKEVLLREIHHRVNNNLQIISSLLNMQCGRLDGVSDVKAIAALEASQQRIQGMARIHNLLYSTENVGEINLVAYVADLAEIVCSSLSGAIRIVRRRELPPVLLSMRQAVPCGLIVNELITNVCKYAYPNSAGGEVDINVARLPGDLISLNISDHGVGIPEGFDWPHSVSLGLQIVSILTKQLGGTLEVHGENGVSVTLQFPWEA